MRKVFQRLFRLRLARREMIAAGVIIVLGLLATPFIASADDLIGGNAPAADQAPPAPTGSLTGPDRVAPKRFCKEYGIWVDEKLKLGSGCAKPITCLLDASSARYRCQDVKGVAVAPPGAVCRSKTESRHYVCDPKSASVYVATLQPYANYTTTAAPVASPPPIEPISTTQPTAQGIPTTTAVPTVTAQPSVVVPADTVAAIRAAKTAKLRVWVEHDLSADYLKGGPEYRSALQALIAAAKQPDVTGVKFADHLGYPQDQGGFTSEADVRQFLTTATGALRAALPGKRLAIEVAVPELGCGASQPCVNAMRTRAPLATSKAVSGYLGAVAVDRVEVADGLWGRSYATYGITQEAASTAQWQAVRALGWNTRTQVTSRQYGLAHAGDASPWRAAMARAKVNSLVIGVLNSGVPTVTLWGHKSATGDGVYRLLNADLATNPLWQALGSKGLRDRLALVIDPASTERGAAADIAALAPRLGEVFILT